MEIKGNGVTAKTVSKPGSSCEGCVFMRTGWIGFGKCTRDTGSELDEAAAAAEALTSIDCKSNQYIWVKVAQ